MDLVSLLVMGSLLAVIFGYCGWIIKRNWLDKQWINEGSRLVGRNVVSQFKNADGQDAIEHVIYISEDEKEEDDQGDKSGPRFKVFDPAEQ